MPKVKDEIPPTLEFEIGKNQGEDKPERNQDQAMNEALMLAKSKGYNQVSLQTYTPKGFYFLAYDKI